VRDRKRMTVADDYARGSGGGTGSREVTGVGCHVRGGARVHEPGWAATVGARVGDGLKGSQQGRVPL
jgi:hypothetical protein